MSKNGNGEGTPPVIENAHIFQEYTYKKITPCDICSQILRGKKHMTFCPRDFLSQGLFVPGTFCHKDFCPMDFCPKDFLSHGFFVPWTF